MKKAILFLLMLFNLNLLWAQGKFYDGPTDPAGDKAAERAGFMTGNRVFLYFQNTTELSKWVNGVTAPLWSRWPNNSSGVRMLDGIALLVGARVFIANDSIPVTDPAEIASRSDLDTLYFLQTSYREEMDTNPIGDVEWGLYPVFGYFNPASEYPAMSNISESWPIGGWPAGGTSTKWPGEWNGRFGRGVIYADLETYFVANDAQDQEYLGPEDRVKYYPRPGVHIGDITPDVSIQKGLPWGGIGIRVSQRGFQWNNPQARDAIFWEYSIANISDYDIPDVAFGYWVDNGIGGEADDEIGFFDRTVDMAYSWDVDGIGRAGLPTGAMGFAYLESPGLPQDGIDNDDDGLTDEKRDNQATSIIGPTDGISDLNKFLTVYNLKQEDLHDHWDADEDQDWQDGIDKNGNNAYAHLDPETNEWIVDSGDNPNDDVGVDGVGPFELNYHGPDADGSEGNHKPDYVPGIGSEPNFATTDVTESDMVGLTSFRLFPVPSHSSSYRWFRGDKSMWQLIGEDSTLKFLGNISNLIETFASGPFPLATNQEERISMAELHAFDDLGSLNDDAHKAPALYAQKRIVQVIYESDYRFAQPPKMPTLEATAGDGKVILTWDDLSDKLTRDPFLGNTNDFEGYKLYRSSDPRFTDSEVITDGFGTAFLKKPIFQVDVADGKQGFTDFGMVNGVGFNLGFDTGIVHHFIDNNVQNGRTYYYALVAYDYGAPDIGPGISPSENPIIIDVDENNSIRTVGQNVAIVRPHQLAAGYKPPEVGPASGVDIFGKGSIEPQILAENSLKPGDTYQITFGIDTIAAVKDTPHALKYTLNSMFVSDLDAGPKQVYSETPIAHAFDNVITRRIVELGSTDTLVYSTMKTGGPFSTDVFDGLRLSINLPYETAAYDYENSQWVTGSSLINISPAVDAINYYPWDFDIVFTGDDSAFVASTGRRNLRDEQNISISRTKLLFKLPYNFYVENKSFPDSMGQYPRLEMVGVDENLNGVFDILEDRVLVGYLNNRGFYAGTAFSMDFKSVPDSSFLPKAGDVYRITYNRPFWVTDTLSFKVNSAPKEDLAAITSTMKDIRVVPNPYVATNSLEQAVPSPFLNQPRRLMFTHIPAQCTIRIFTVSGNLVDRIDVSNPAEDGTAFWDLLSNEGLEVAAGMYIYHVKATQTGDTRIGKFAIVK